MSHISNEKWKLLNERMQMLGIKESELQESFIQGGGSGGQKINKTSSTVVLTYKSIKFDVRSLETATGIVTLQDVNYANLSQKSLACQPEIRKKFIRQ